MHTTEWNRELLQKTLREIMVLAELSQAAVGELAGRDRTMANRWLSGRHQPAYEAASRFATAIAERHPDLAHLAQQFMSAAGYGDRAPSQQAVMAGTLPAAEGAFTGTVDVARNVLNALRVRAQAENRSLGEVLVADGLADPVELVIPDALEPDPIITEINESDISPESKEAIIRMHLENRARHFEKARLERERKKLDGQ